LGKAQRLAESWGGIEIRRVPFVARSVHKGIQLLGSGLGSDWPYFASACYFREYFWQVARRLRHHTPDVIHLPQQFQFAGMLRRACPAAKIVLHAHQDEIAQLDAGRVLAALRNVDAIVTVSDYVTQRIRARFPDLAVHTIGNGVDVRRFSPANDRRNVPPRRILFVGRISPDKGVHVLIGAFAALAARRRDLDLVLVGKPGFLPLDQLALLLKGNPAFQTLLPYYGHSLPSSSGLSNSFASWFSKVVIDKRSSYRSALYQRLGGDVAARVHFVGTVPLPELVALYRSADVLVLPSVWNESYGLPIAEAMASGVPVLASDCGGIPELVNDRVTGRLVPRGDVHALAAALDAMLTNRDQLRAMGRAARLRAERCLTWERSARALEHIYTGLTATGRQNRRSGKQAPTLPIPPNPTIAPR
jgi:glycosyltransferase involved in cell wall biosynthesis